MAGRQPTKPVILAEGAYEDGPPVSKSSYPTGPITAAIIRKQAYWTYLSGGFFTYGYDHMWEHPPYWEAALNSEGARNMHVLRKIFGRVSWWNLHPDQSLFASGEGGGQTYNAAAISSDGSWAMVYLSSPATVKLNLDKLESKPNKTTRATRFSVTWIDPRTGHRSQRKPCAASGEKNLVTPSGWQDAVLLFERSGK